MFKQDRFYGVVEDIFDPLENNRVRVRVFFYHTAQKSKNDSLGIPTDELLWFPVSGTGCVSGIGDSSMNLKNGMIVWGEFRDEFKQDGIVMGSLVGFTQEMPDFNNGFTDPNQVFPTKLGNDVNILARSSSEHDTLYNNKKLEIHNNDTNSIGMACNNFGQSGSVSLKDMLIIDCGYNNRAVFRDNKFVIGIGHIIDTSDASVLKQYLLDNGKDETIIDLTISDSSIQHFFDNDINKAKSKVSTSTDIVRRDALTVLEFHGFNTSILSADLLAQRYRDAYEKIPSHFLYNRARLMILSGDYSSYVSSIDVKKSKSDSKYPYNKVTQTENGFIIELDDTPNAQRYRFKHPSNSFYEYNVDGDKSEVLVGDDYKIVRKNKNLSIHGDFNLSISGKCVLYVMGDLQQTVVGDVEQIVHGDNKQTIHGDSEQIINGDLKTQEIDGNIYSQTINGNATQTINGNNEQIVNGNNIQTIELDNTQIIKGANNIVVDKSETVTIKESNYVFIDGDCEQTVGGNVKQSISGNVSQTIGGGVTSTASGDYVVNASSFTVNASGNIKMDAGGAAQVNGATALINASGTAQISGATIVLN